ncbi:MAG: hypothetical protein HKO65_04515 [Gemmatimonadetes bacterium]|nr:hypothetical protein [Gemmatimonadota bacterium]NNM04343.1 hypothetical protein [Gemmatimonadota bacterium]
MESTPSPHWRWAPLGLIAGFLVLGIGVWEPMPPGIWHDDGVYVLLGKSLAEGEGLRYLGVPGAPLAPKFPPLFPALLAVVWLIFPSFPENVSILGSVNIVLTAIAGGVFFLYLRSVLGLSDRFALFSTGLIWISAHLWRAASVPLSEPLFLLLLLLALWAGGRMESRKGSAPVLWFLLAGGLAVYARTLGVGLFAAGVISLFMRWRRRDALLLGLGAVGCLLPWVVWSGWAAASIPEPFRDVLGPYGGWLVAQVRQDPTGFMQFALANAGHLLARTVTLNLPGIPGPQLLYGLVMAPIALLGLWEIFRRSRVLALTLVFSLGILMIWPFQEIRLLVPFQPLLILSLIMGMWRLLKKTGGFPLAKGALSVAAVSWVLLFSGMSLYRLSTGWTSASYRIRAEALLDAVRAVNENTPTAAVVGAPEMWAGLNLFTGRTTLPSARFRPLSGNEPIYGTPQQQYQTWIQGGVSHVLVEHGGQVHGAALDRIDALCPPGTIQVLDIQPGRILVGLHWDGACQQDVLEEGGQPPV